MVDDDYLFLNSSKLINAYKAKKVSPVEVIQSSIKKAKLYNKEFNFVTEFIEEDALKKAKISENNYLKSNNLNILEGVPLSVKDEFALKGSYRTSGSEIFKNRKDDYTDTYTSRLIKGGCIPVLKTTTPEFCLLGTTWSNLHGITKNPWNKKFSPGGSSGGTGVSLALGCTPIGTGTDIGGSIRIPASACGVFGFKPPYGRNPEIPIMNLDYYSHSGPMARSAYDIYLMQSLTSGPSNDDITSLPAIENFKINRNILKGLKIAWSDHLCGFEIEKDVRNNLLETINLFRKNGAIVKEVELNWPKELIEYSEIYLNAFWGTYLAEKAINFEDIICAYTKKFIEFSKNRKISDIIKSNEIAWKAYTLFTSQMEDFDIFICPTNAVTGIPANYGYPNLNYEFDGKTRITKGVVEESLWLTTPFNMLSRLPVMSVPSGFSSNGVPTGIQIVGKVYDDQSVLNVSIAYEEIIDWLFDVNNRPSL